MVSERNSNFYLELQNRVTEKSRKAELPNLGEKINEKPLKGPPPCCLLQMNGMCRHVSDSEVFCSSVQSCHAHSSRYNQGLFSEVFRSEYAYIHRISVLKYSKREPRTFSAIASYSVMFTLKTRFETPGSFLSARSKNL